MISRKHHKKNIFLSKKLDTISKHLDMLQKNALLTMNICFKRQLDAYNSSVFYKNLVKFKLLIQIIL
jgi:hypothetical protein